LNVGVNHSSSFLKRIREIMGLKQEVLGSKCPGNYSQQRISEFENQWTIDEPTLKELAEGLGVTVEFIRAFNEEKAIYNIQNNNTFTVSENSMGVSNQPTINNGSDKLESLLVNLTKVVADLAEEVKKLRGDAGLL